MNNTLLFPMADYWWFYLAFVAFVLLLLALDLGVFHKKAHAVGIKESAVWSGIWISLALIFCTGLYYYTAETLRQNPRLDLMGALGPEALAKDVALQFLAGFVIEKALAIDNIFVFVVIFGYFAIPPLYQHRILFFGIIGALVCRAFFIAVGAALLQYQWVVIGAGLFLIVTGAKILFVGDSPSDPGQNWVVKAVRKVIPVSPELDGPRFFTRRSGTLMATPLLLTLLVVEVSDVIFAIDSVPAIFAVTKEPLIVFTSNIFAILGLRSLYFLLAGIVDRFRYLKYGLGLILIFVGLKMTWLNQVFDGHFPIGLSLGIIGAILAISIGVSFVKKLI